MRRSSPVRSSTLMRRLLAPSRAATSSLSLSWMARPSLFWVCWMTNAIWEVMLAVEGVRVLIVEDDEDTREFLTLGLELHGAEVEAVASAREALAAVREFGPHVILSDIGLPDEDGLSLIRKVRQLPAAQGRIPAAA